MLITLRFYMFLPEGHWEPRNGVGSLSPAERLLGFNWEPSDSDNNVWTH